MDRCSNHNIKRSQPIEIANSAIPRNLSIVTENNIEERLKRAALVAKEALSTKADLPPPLTLSHHIGCSIIVEETIIAGSSQDVYITVQKGDGTPLLSIPKSSYRYLYLTELTDCRIFIKCKLLRLMVDRCHGIQVSLRAPMIGPVEFFKSTNCNLTIRFSEEGTIPIVCIEDCNVFQIYQSNDTLVYLIKCSAAVTGTIVDELSGMRVSKHDLGKLIWGEQERSLVCLSRSEGFAIAPYKYALNDLTHHIFALPPDEEVESPRFDDIFGKTPPTHF